MILKIENVEKFLNELSDASPDPVIGFYEDQAIEVLKRYEVKCEPQLEKK